jgi:endonuclease/exonuclease/phosphatase family metal-dependent hydrolase
VTEHTTCGILSANLSQSLNSGSDLITLLFWNIAKNAACLEHLACLADAHEVDVFILAECSHNVSLDRLNGLGKGQYELELNANAKVQAITRLGSRAFIHRYTSLGREMAVWSAVGNNADEILIAGVHLMSKFGGTTENDQALVAGELITELNGVEDRQKHRNTVMLGDFNMQPYDSGMTNPIAMHSLMTRQLAERPDRIHRNKLRRSFYNPMWGLFGDRTAGPPGSHYWRSSSLSNTHWGILDQVLLRRDLIERLNDVRILGNDGQHSLMDSNDIPTTDYLSDHLPVLAVLSN